MVFEMDRAEDNSTLRLLQTNPPQTEPVTDKPLEKHLIHQLRDLYNAETQVQSALGRWASQPVPEELSEFVEERRQAAGERTEALEEVCEALGADPTGEKCHGMEGLIAEGDAAMEDAAMEQKDSAEGGGENPARGADLIANVRRVEHYFLAGYAHARTCAGSLGREDLKGRLQEVLNGAIETDKEASQHTEQLIVSGS